MIGEVFDDRGIHCNGLSPRTSPSRRSVGFLIGLAGLAGRPVRLGMAPYGAGRLTKGSDMALIAISQNVPPFSGRMSRRWRLFAWLVGWPGWLPAGQSGSERFAPIWRRPPHKGLRYGADRHIRTYPHFALERTPIFKKVGEIPAPPTALTGASPRIRPGMYVHSRKL
jgi:hypothetical protein